MRLSLTDARESLVRAVRPLPAESGALPAAAGRIILEAITARLSLPPSNCAAVDGYAIRVADVAGYETPGLRLAGMVTAGSALPSALPPRHCIAIMTGAPLPPGADAVIPSEAAQRDGETVVVAAVPEVWSGTRRAGQETRSGETLVSPGTPADARTLERLAGQGITRVSVPRRARVHVVATGDELVPPGEEPGTGQRVASNLPMLEALVRSCGGEVKQGLVAPDDAEQLRQVLAASLAGDLVLTLGGTLRGSRDLTKGVLRDLGAAFLFDGVAIRPGSSCAAATGGNAMIVCLPGSPGAACLGFLALVRPLLRALHGWSRPIPTFAARLVEPVEPAAAETILVLGVVQDAANGLEFRRRGQGWPALGMLEPPGAGEPRDPAVIAELLPHE